MTIEIYQGDIIDNIVNVKDETYSVIFCDPPYGLSANPNAREVLSSWMNTGTYSSNDPGFKGENWDNFVPGPNVWTELFRTAKPGAILIVYCGTRTSDLMGVSIRLGGWQKFDEIDIYGPHDQLSWIYGSGMPKSENLSKRADKRAGMEGEIIEERQVRDIRNGHGREYGSALFAGETTGKITHTVRKPASQDAIDWYGYGTGLAPAHEVLLMFRKPSGMTFLDTALTYGTGSLNLQAASFGIEKNKRLPKNVIMQCCEHSLPECNCPISEIDGQVGPSTSKKSHRGAGINGNLFKSPKYESTVRGQDDSGSRARFFYVDKPSVAEKYAGLEDRPDHPTMKPITLDFYIAQMVVVPEPYRDEAIICIPFSGTGSEAIGAMLAGWKNIHMYEQNPAYVAVSSERLSWWESESKRLNSTDIKYILQNREETHAEI